jgi:hypothetical protein
MSNKPKISTVLALVRLLSRGRIQISFGRQGAVISAENALAIIAAVVVLALLF